MVQYTFSLLPVVLGAVGAMIIGALWYSPLLFGNIWMKESKITPAQVEEAKKKGGMWKYYLGSFIATLVMIFVFASLAFSLSTKTITSAIGLAILVWLGFFIPVLLNSVLWEGKSFKLFLINIAHHLVALIVAAIIIGLFF
ncbi:MAG TPA: DUF1761 domain-containing protein [Candidatus Nanoarchaeia archaeon]|nr:DUF1761 domain-containing protein [Candidatus Nanoarchaeia archaeon]